MILRVGIIMLLARKLTPNEIGVATACMLVGSVIEVIALVPIGPSLIQRHELSTCSFPTAFIGGTLVAIGAAVLLNCLSTLVVGLVGIDEVGAFIRIISVGIIFKGIGLASSSLLQREMKFKTLTTIEFVAFFIGNVAVCIPMVFFEMGPSSIIVGAAVEAIIGAILLIGIRWPGDLRQFSWTEFVEQINFGLSLYLARLANYAMRNLDRWIIGRTLGPQTLGYFSRANQTVSTIESIFGQIFGRIIFAGFSRVQQNLDLAKIAYLKSLSVLSFGSFLTSAWLIVCAENVITIVLGSSWLIIQTPFQIVCLGIFFRLSFNCMVNVCRSQGEVHSLVGYSWLCAAISGCSCALLWKYGLNALAAAGVIVGGSQFILFGKGVQSVLTIPLTRQMITVVPGLFAGLAFAAILSIMRQILLELTSPSRASWAISLIGAIFLSGFALFYWVSYYSSATRFIVINKMRVSILGGLKR